MNRRNLLVCLLALCLVSCSGSTKKELQEVRIASGGHIVHFLPLDLAVAKGFFKDEGLDPKITQLKGGTATAQALLAGQVDFSMNSIDHAFKAATQGKDNLRMVCLLNQTPGMVLVASAKQKDSIKAIADLKGKKLGVTAKGSATHMVLSSLLVKSGVNPQEVTVLGVGADTFVPALDAGEIDGGIALEPFASIMQEQGKVFVLADLNGMADTKRIFGGPYNQAGVLTTEELIAKNPALVQKVVNVHLRALKWIHEHKPQEIIDALPAEVTGSDKARYKKTIEKLREFYSPNGKVDPLGAKSVYESMIAAKALNSETSITEAHYFNNNFVHP